MVGLEWPFLGNPEVLGLVGGHLGQFDAQLLQVQTGHHLIEMLRQHVDRVFGVPIGVVVQFHLGQNLVGERGTHHEGWVAGGTSKIQQTAFGQHDDGVAFGQLEFVDLWLDLDFLDTGVGFEI